VPVETWHKGGNVVPDDPVASRPRTIATVRSVAFDAAGSSVRWSDLSGGLPARVFLHGMGGIGWATFGDVAGHRSLVIDLPGHGLSDRPSTFGYTLDDHASVIARVCEAAGLDSIDLVGHSLGADIAVVAMGRYPGLVGRLVVAEANLDPLPRSTTARFSQRIAMQSEEDFVARGYQEILDTAPDWTWMLRLCDPRAVYRSAVGLITGTRPTMREMLLDASIPRTFIRGEQGEDLVDPAGLEAAGVRIVMIPGAGHVMMADNPSAFVAALLDAFPSSYP
jgi:pimeloyl-ACP methyl ester carboxylesterase